MRGRIVILDIFNPFSIPYEKYTVIVMRKSFDELESIISFLRDVKRLTLHVSNSVVDLLQKKLRIGEPDVIFRDYRYDPYDTIILLNENYGVVMEIWKGEMESMGDHICIGIESIERKKSVNYVNI